MTATLWWQISAQSPVRRSSAITLTLHWLTFGSQQFAKRPDMVRPSGGHARGALTPLGREEARGVWLRRRQRDAPTHVRPSNVVASLQQHPAAPPVGPIFPDAPVWTTQRRSGMPQGQGETRKQTGAQREPPVLPARGTAASTGDTVRETALLLRLDPLPVDQRRRGRRDGLRGGVLAGPYAARSAGSGRPRAGPRGHRCTPHGKSPGPPKTPAAVLWRSCQARSNVRGPTQAARRRRNAGAHLLHTPCRPSARSAGLAPSGSACWAGGRRMQVPLASRCPGVPGRSCRQGTWIACAVCAARRRHARTVAAVTPKTKRRSARATLTRRLFKAIMTFSSGVLRSKKTVARVSEQGHAHVLQPQTRRVPLWVIEGAMALRLPRFIRREWAQAGLGHDWPQAWGCRRGQSSDRVVV